MGTGFRRSFVRYHAKRLLASLPTFLSKLPIDHSPYWARFDGLYLFRHRLEFDDPDALSFDLFNEISYSMGKHIATLVGGNHGL